MVATGRVGNIKSLGVTVEAAFGYDPDDTSPSWTDISDYVRGFSTRRGRKREIDRVTAGSCTVLLDNRDRRFEGGYTSGAYGSNVVPMVPIRITTTRNAVTYPVFYGFADEWVPSLDASQPRDAVVLLRATDAFKVLSLIPAPQSVWDHEVAADSPTSWFKFNETRGTTLIEESGRNGFYTNQVDSVTGLIPYVPGSAARFTGSDWAQCNDLAVIPTGPPFTAEMWIRLDADLTAASESQWIVQADAGSSAYWVLLHNIGSPALRFSSTYAPTLYVTAPITTAVRLHVMVVVAAAGASASMYINGANAGTTTVSTAQVSPGINSMRVGKTGSSLADNWTGTIDELVQYSSDLSADAASRYLAAVAPWDGDRSDTRIGRILDLAVWPAGLRALDTGTSYLGPVTLDGRATIDLLWETVEFESGNMWVARDGDLTFKSSAAPYIDTVSTVSQATYSYTGTNGKYAGVSFDYSDELLRNHAVITTSGGVTYEAEDATSIGRYLRRTKEQRIPQADTSHAQGLADWIVLKQKNPQRRITSLAVQTSRDTTTFDATVALDLGYRVTVALDPVGTGTISEAVIVEGIDHNVTPNGWSTMLWCSPSPESVVDVFVIGTDSIGGTAIIGY